MNPLAKRLEIRKISTKAIQSLEFFLITLLMFRDAGWHLPWNGAGFNNPF